MIIDIIRIACPDDYTKLWNKIPPDYLSPGLIKQFQTLLASSVKSIIVEYPYVDKDYRSTYYGFYSKRHRSYDKFCFRLHLFDLDIEKEDDLPGKEAGYLGSMVLRQTEVTPMGRTLISPRTIKSFQGFICDTTFQNNLLGIPLKVSTFPHIMQDTDVSVCAHAVCWMIARYYSERYCVYPERLTYDIVTAVKDISGGRTIPSRGITLGQVSEILASIGFYPEILVREAYRDPSFFYDVLYAYIESGIPIVAGLGRKEHAVAILGHGPLNSAVDVARHLDGPFINARHCMTSFVVNDDNRLPFMTMENLDDVDGFVVPLYEKMYLSADHVLNIYSKLASGGLLDIPTKGKRIARVYMTSSRSYKRHIRSSGDLNPDLRRAQLEIPMPKFIWIVEIATPDDYDKKQTAYRWVMDATANQYEKYPFLLVHDANKMIVHDRAFRGELFHVRFSEQLAPFALFENNLRRYP